MKSEDVIVKEKHIKWDKIFYGDDWVNNVVETIRTKDILQSVYLKRYLITRDDGRIYYRDYYGLRIIS